MSCIKSLPEICRLGIARVGIRTLLLVLFTCVMQHTAVLLGNSSTLNKRGENPPRCNRTTPADLSLANRAVAAQTIFSFPAVMGFHEALTITHPPPEFILSRRSTATNLNHDERTKGDDNAAMSGKAGLQEGVRCAAKFLKNR